MAAIASNIRAAKAQNIGRQPVSGISHCTGKVEASMPSEPAINIQELARITPATLNQRR